ncbi:hypothetical protein PVAND_000352 [Polypedilum vanderplanki]|uniref:Cytidyltransferase-like domain-containing protein n=1 Tax=Polypedilum vanderplanki TaxID=319348 RepID=A0A9J6BK06_POLVA|nr:hypothetical protein PVAND_000352 [Polypedilum vanderplanki]
MTNKVMLIACGSYNPVTPMHLRMFEIANDHFTQLGTTEVVGGIVSPVHDLYGKKGLASQTHRIAMLKLALKTSNWIRVSEWETQQEGWTRTRNTLQYHQNYLNSIIRDLNGMNSSNLPSWVPENIRQIKEPVQLKLLCGADLLESFATPGLWEKEDLEAILGQHGIVVISRNGSDVERFIFESDLLSQYRPNINIVTNWIANEVSSTLARRFISRGLSVKYIIDDYVIEYINKHGLYRTLTTTADETSKFILPPTSTTTTEISVIDLTPISPESESSTFNESYVKKQNEKNESSVVEEYESMDETDFPPPPPPIASTKSSLTVDYITGSSSSLQKVFCCASSDGTAIRLMRPGSAVQVHDDEKEDNDKSDKVSENEQYDAQTHPINTPDDDYGAADDTPTPSPRSPEQIEIIAPDEDQTDSESLNAPISKAHGRFSPKSYDEMIKFVFTEHGIRVISDKEYVV